MNTEEDDDTLDELTDDANPITDDEDNMKIEISLNVKNYRLFKAKSAQTLSWGKIDASLAKEALTATEASHLDAKALITKLNDVAKIVNLGVSTTLAEKNKDPVPGTVRWRLRERCSCEAKSPVIQQSRRLLPFFPEYNQLWSIKRANCCAIMNFPAV